MSDLVFVDSTGAVQEAGAANPLPVSGTINTVSGGVATNAVNGHASATDTTSTSLIAAVSAKKIYVTGWAFSNSGATAVTVTFQDGSGGAQIGPLIEVPAGGGNNMPSGGGAWFNSTAGNAVFFAASGSTSTLYGGAVGFSAT